MDRQEFVGWLTEMDRLTVEQRAAVGRFLSGEPSLEVVTGLLESRVDQTRRCPHCATEGAVIHGRSSGLKRYRCRDCGRTFNALTGTPLAQLHRKELWPTFAASLGAGETIAAGAERYGVAGSTAFRWRHRFLAAVSGGVTRLRGIVEADETFVLASRKGERKLDRKARRRGGKASKRGLSDEQVPILIAADRRRPALAPLGRHQADPGPVLGQDALLVTDGAVYYPPVAAALGVSHEALNQSAGERVRGDLHIQTVNSRHERFRKSNSGSPPNINRPSTRPAPHRCRSLTP